MAKTVYLFSGEGTSSSQTGCRLLKHSPRWSQITDALDSLFGLSLEQLWSREIGRHRGPYSPLLTVISQLCLSDLWRRWGYAPDVVVGHSTGELAAAYEAGFYSLEEILTLAERIGTVASHLDGVMLHGFVTDKQIEQLRVNISSFNFTDGARKHITLSGYAAEMDEVLKALPDFIPMRLPHPWHHPDYHRFVDQLPPIKARPVQGPAFLSGVTTQFETHLKEDYWHDWFVKPIDFIQTMRTLDALRGRDHLQLIEIGFHPVLQKCCDIFRHCHLVSSMYRGEDDIAWILFQRRKLPANAFRNTLKPVVDAFRPGLDYSASLAYQGFSSLAFTELSVLLQPFFPSLSPHDFYRYKTLDQLIERFGTQTVAPPRSRSHQKNSVVIRAMSCRFPSSVETLTQFWDMLLSRQDQVGGQAGRGVTEAGYLSDTVSRFDYRFFDIAPSEAAAMDPQQMLALELTEMLWREAGIDPAALDRKRVGVYIGAWNQEYGGDSASVFHPTGTNPSIIASRISFHYDLRGPSWVANTACSSSLVAVHYAAKDIEAGRVDYAIAGGVNLLLDEAFTASMRKSGFLSADNRCKAFDDSANGYVRAEGGGLVLLANKDLVRTYYAELKGSSINQNGGRSQLISAPHPEAQEELLAEALADAGISPHEIAYLECHGTGTKIGDPIEISAIRNVIAKNRKQVCYIGSVKSTIGHLESAAGIAGLIKAVLVLNHGLIPPNLHFAQPNPHIDFETTPIRVVTQPTPIDRLASIGISSFGFGGANAHVIVQGAAETVRKKIKPLEVPFDRSRGTPLSSAVKLLETAPAAPPVAAPPVAAPQAQSAGDCDVHCFIQSLIVNVTGVEAIDPEKALLDQGLDSLSATELFNSLEEQFRIEIEPDLLFDFPLIDQFVEEIEKRVAAKAIGQRIDA